MISPPAIFIMGPTAAGKSDLAIHLAQHLPCDIISVDSAMVYRGMDIGTAKPSRATLQCIPHRLIDIRDPRDAYSAAQFRSDALREMDQSTRQGRIPLLVGGTMLYFRALQRGLADLPAADNALRARLEGEARALGWVALHARLAIIDAEAARRIHPNDPQRIQRALEVYELTGRKMSELQGESGAASLPYSVIKIIVAPADRDWLREHIARRFQAMLQAGLIAEVEALRKRGDLDLHTPALRAVGYRQVWQYLAGEINCDEMIKSAIITTCQLAKRQFTWLRVENEAVWFDSLGKDLFDIVLNFCADALLAHK